MLTFYSFVNRWLPVAVEEYLDERKPLDVLNKLMFAERSGEDWNVIEYECEIE